MKLFVRLLVAAGVSLVAITVAAATGTALASGGFRASGSTTRVGLIPTSGSTT